MRRIPVLLLGLLALPAAAGATTKVTKQARPGDIASEYELTESGDLFRQVGKHRCQITNGVTEFRVASHPLDEGAIYFVKAGDLKVLLPPARATSGCPKADVRTVVPSVKKYALVTDPKSPVVLMSLDADDHFQGFGPEGRVNIRDVADFVMNACYGQDGRSFSSYSAFIIDAYGLVTRLKGKEPGEKTDFKRAYTSLDEFKTVNRVCSTQ